MTYQLNFSALWPYLPELFSGLLITMELTAMATIGGIALGVVGAAIRCSDNHRLDRVILRRMWGGYVEIVRNTPFVVQLFFIVFGLPARGVEIKCRAGGSVGDDHKFRRLQYRDYPCRDPSQCQRPVGGRSRARAEPQSDFFPGDFAAVIAADLSGAGQSVHYCDARFCGGFAGIV